MKIANYFFAATVVCSNMLFSADQASLPYVVEQRINGNLVSEGASFNANDDLLVKFEVYCESPNGIRDFYARVYWQDDCNTDILFDQLILTLQGTAEVSITSTTNRDPDCSDVFVVAKIFEHDDQTQSNQSDSARFSGN